jgi:hypothetical protein
LCAHQNSTEIQCLTKIWPKELEGAHFVSDACPIMPAQAWAAGVGRGFSTRWSILGSSYSPRLGVLFAGRDPSDRGHYRSQRSRGRTYLPIAAALALENSQLCLCKKTLSFRIPTSPIAKDQTWRDSTELVEEVEPHAGSRACALCLKYCGVTLVRC